MSGPETFLYPIMEGVRVIQPQSANGRGGNVPMSSFKFSRQIHHDTARELESLTQRRYRRERKATPNSRQVEDVSQRV